MAHVMADPYTGCVHGCRAPLILAGMKATKMLLSPGLAVSGLVAHMVADQTQAMFILAGRP